MSRPMPPWFGLLLLAGACAAQGESLPWEIWQSPATLAMLKADDALVMTSSRCPAGCRFDRSNAGGESPLDNPWPLRWLYSDGDEVVLLDEPGPGAITRFWLTTGFGSSSCIDPATRIRFYLDGASVPTIDLPLAALFDGSTPPFTPPLVADRDASSGGYVSHVPIAWAQSLRIGLGNAQGGGNPCTVDGRRLLWYQIEHHRLPPGTVVTSFTAGHDEPVWREFLTHAGDDPWHGLLAPETATLMLTAGADLPVLSRVGSGWLRAIRLHLPRAAYADVGVRVRVDGMVAVDMPLSDFYATGPEAQWPARSVLLGEDAAGWLYAWWPMPYRSSLAVELYGAASLAAPISIDTDLRLDSSPVPAAAGQFSATLGDQCRADGTFVLDQAQGAGKIVGLGARYRADGLVSRGYLEGDEQATVDGASAPVWHGTGVEDLFDGGFYFDHGSFANALTGATEIDSEGNGASAVHRLLLSDALPYTDGLRLVQEAGYSPSQPVPMCARYVVHAYRHRQPLLITYETFEIGDTAAATAHDHVGAPGAQCVSVQGIFEGYAAPSRVALACTSTSGSIHFRFDATGVPRPLRLRRSFDVGGGMPGVTAGSAGARVLVNGAFAGAFAPVAANVPRRWQEQEALLTVPELATVLEIEVVPDYSGQTPWFSESRWALRGGWRDVIFRDAFEF